MILSGIFILLSLLTIIGLSILFFSVSPYLIILYIVLFPLIYALWFCIYVVFLFITTLFINKKKNVKKPSPFYNSLLKQSVHELFRYANIKVHFNTNNLIPENQNFVLVCNHVSNFDPMIFIDQFKQRLVCVSKPENERIPICGPLMHKAGFIKIDRSNAFNALKSINVAADYIKKDYCSILIFPEGTRSKSGELLEFHPGSFKIGVKANAPIVICSIKNTNKIHKNFPFKRTHVYIDVLDVINADSYESMNTIEMAKKAETLIKDNLKKY